jgi:hypothetical protein
MSGLLHSRHDGRVFCRQKDRCIAQSGYSKGMDRRDRPIWYNGKPEVRFP